MPTRRYPRKRIPGEATSFGKTRAPKVLRPLKDQSSISVPSLRPPDGLSHVSGGQKREKASTGQAAEPSPARKFDVEKGSPSKKVPAAKILLERRSTGGLMKQHRPSQVPSLGKKRPRAVPSLGSKHLLRPLADTAEVFEKNVHSMDISSLAIPDFEVVRHILPIESTLKSLHSRNSSANDRSRSHLSRTEDLEMYRKVGVEPEKPAEADARVKRSHFAGNGRAGNSLSWGRSPGVVVRGLPEHSVLRGASEALAGNNHSTRVLMSTFGCAPGELVTMLFADGALYSRKEVIQLMKLLAAQNRDALAAMVSYFGRESTGSIEAQRDFRDALRPVFEETGYHLLEESQTESLHEKLANPRVGRVGDRSPAGGKASSQDMLRTMEPDEDPFDGVAFFPGSGKIRLPGEDYTEDHASQAATVPLRKKPTAAKLRRRIQAGRDGQQDKKPDMGASPSNVPRHVGSVEQKRLAATSKDTKSVTTFADEAEDAVASASKVASSAAAIAEEAERRLHMTAEDEVGTERKPSNGQSENIVEELRGSNIQPLELSGSHGQETRRRERRALRRAKEALCALELRKVQWIGKQTLPKDYADGVDDQEVGYDGGHMEPRNELFTATPTRGLRKLLLTPARSFTELKSPVRSRTTGNLHLNASPLASPLYTLSKTPSITGSVAVASPKSSTMLSLSIEQECQTKEDVPTKVLLVASGAYNPIHKLHLRMLYLAREFLEQRAGLQVIGGIISPSHATLVRQQQRRNVKEIIPPRHRLNMARRIVGDSKWLSVDAWEITRRRIMDYLSVLQHVREVAERTWPGVLIRVVYLTKPYGMLKLSPKALRENGFGCLCVCRPVESERLLRQMAVYDTAEKNPWEGVAHVVEDAAMLTHKLERTTSSAVRSDLMANKDVEPMVGPSVAAYAFKHAIGDKMAGRVKWQPEEKEVQWCEEDGVRPYRTEPPEIRRVEDPRASWAGV